MNVVREEAPPLLLSDENLRCDSVGKGKFRTGGEKRKTVVMMWALDSRLIILLNDIVNIFQNYRPETGRKIPRNHKCDCSTGSVDAYRSVLYT